MTSPNASRLQDALHYMREANKYAERGIFKKPDWDLAAQNYEKAAQAFKAAQSYNEAVSAYVKSSDAMLHSFSHFMAGRALENAAAILELNLGPPEHVADLYRRAGNLYLQDFKPDRAAEMLVKGAKALENASLEKAIKEYMNACNLYESENLERYATDAFKSFIGMLVRNNRLGQAIEILQRLGNIQSKTPNVYSYYKTLLSIVVVQLAIGDEVEAENRFRAFCNTIGGFTHSEECSVAGAMLQAFNRRDQGYFNYTANRTLVGFLEPEITRLARGIVVTNDISVERHSAGHSFSLPPQLPLRPPSQHQQDQRTSQNPLQPPRPFHSEYHPGLHQPQPRQARRSSLQLQQSAPGMANYIQVPEKDLFNSPSPFRPLETPSAPPSEALDEILNWAQSSAEPSYSSPLEPSIPLPPAVSNLNHSYQPQQQGLVRPVSSGPSIPQISTCLSSDYQRPPQPDLGHRGSQRLSKGIEKLQQYPEYGREGGDIESIEAPPPSYEDLFAATSPSHLQRPMSLRQTSSAPPLPNRDSGPVEQRLQPTRPYQSSPVPIGARNQLWERNYQEDGDDDGLL